MFSRFGLVLLSIGLLIAPDQPSRARAASLSPKQIETLTFSDRVAYQRAIEEAYWGHRIWPKENPGGKPALNEVMPMAQSEKKVEDYLRNSQLLADQWQRPITPGQLQAEMDRMARDTKQPEVLRELFEALDNDPLVIAECLARPILAERIIGNLAGHAQQVNNFGELGRGCAADLESIGVKLDNAAYKLPEISVPSDCANDTWTTTITNNAPAARDTHTAVWTGTEMIIWGGGGSVGSFNTGGKYNPATNSWTPTTTTNSPLGRYWHSAVWTGAEMIVWGGIHPSNYLNTGGRFNPGTNSWTATTTINAPAGRYSHTAVWTGTEMIVWGGYNGGKLSTGGRYNPGGNSWTVTSLTNAPAARDTHTAVWTGSEMIVWGGITDNYTNSGGRYNPGTNGWGATSIATVPSARGYHTAVWTGNEMIIWGGAGQGYHNTGGRYNPGTNSWADTSTSANTPGPRSDHTAIWTGADMIVWGGIDDIGRTSTGGRYFPSSDTWIATSNTNVPSARVVHTAVWSGTEMIVWGGFDDVGDSNTGRRYCAQVQSASVPQSAVSRKTHGVAGSFDVNLPLTGTPGIECRTGGATNDHVMVLNFSANVTVNGNPQAAMTAGSGSVGSEGMSNGGMVFVNGNIVMVPLTNVTNAQTINVTLFSVNGASNVVIPMSVLAGDVNRNAAVNASDVASTKSRIGQPLNQANFRADVSAEGSINASDVSLVKSHIGTGLP